MPIVKCKICSKDFYAKPFWIKRGNGKYCSTKCQYEGARKGEERTCFICKKKTYKTKLQLKRAKSQKFFCSKSCQTKWRNTEFVGPKHANWKKGEFAYRSILNRCNLPKKCSKCGLCDKRVLAVHHIDHNHSNNKLENLTWLCHNCHHLIHCYKNEREKFMVTIV
ncbi:MAG: hypothetical protein WCW87_00975 [Candidatus Paceibacterota bacterium]